MAESAELGPAPAPAKKAEAPSRTDPADRREALEGRPGPKADRDYGKLLNGRASLVAQRKGAERLAGREAPRPRPIQPAAANRTGLPGGLKAGVEALSGVSLDGVKVHYNSSKPAQLQALAYAQGRDIHLGPGQERHLPHEAWHVAQQAQGRVKPTRQMKGGLPVNDDKGLEREADLMGAKALGHEASQSVADRQGGLALAPPLLQLAAAGGTVQLAPATVNPQSGPINLQQVGALPGLLTMQNQGQPAGNPVSNVVGFTGVLNAGSWAGLGKSPADFWRAHAYAESFGGAGDGTNVGWWRASAENSWTGYEQMVRGAGLAQIAEWLPGVGEQGTYQVDRKMHPAIGLKPGFVDQLVAAANWAFDDSRPAWTRALATCDDIQPAKARDKRVAVLKAAKQVTSGNIANAMQNWINNLFGTGVNLETNLISGMKMTYTITAPGVGAGADRRNLSKWVSSEKPKPAEFGLQKKPDEIWEQLVAHNTGMFAQANPPINNLVGLVAYDDATKPAQQLTSYDDGWGSA